MRELDHRHLLQTQLPRRQHPAMPGDDPLSPSTNTGLVQPNSLMLAAICATWASEWVRGLRAYGISSPSGRQAIARSSILGTSQKATNRRSSQGRIQGFRGRAAGYPPPEFRGHKHATARPVPAGRSRRQMTSPRGLARSAPAALARGLGSWQGLQAGAQLLSSQNSRWSPRCGTTWSTTVAGTTRPWPDRRRTAGAAPGRQPGPGASADRSLGVPRSDAAGPASRFTSAALRAPAGRCTGGFTGNGGSTKQNPPRPCRAGCRDTSSSSGRRTSSRNPREAIGFVARNRFDLYSLSMFRRIMLSGRV